MCTVPRAPRAPTQLTPRLPHLPPGPPPPLPYPYPTLPYPLTCRRVPDQLLLALQRTARPLFAKHVHRVHHQHDPGEATRPPHAHRCRTHTHTHTRAHTHTRTRTRTHTGTHTYTHTTSRPPTPPFITNVPPPLPFFPHHQFNVANMPAGGYSTRFAMRASAVPMSVQLTAYPKTAGLDPISLTDSKEIDTAVRTAFPIDGVSNFDVLYTVPVGYDKVSASVQMFADAGPPPPPTPPAPPGTVCPCPNTTTDGTRVKGGGKGGGGVSLPLQFV